MIDQLPILAIEIGDLLRALIPIIMLLIWVASQVIGAKREAQADGPKAGKHGGEDPPEDRELREEIEKFLREAAGEQPQQEAETHQQPRDGLGAGDQRSRTQEHQRQVNREQDQQRRHDRQSQRQPQQRHPQAQPTRERAAPQTPSRAAPRERPKPEIVQAEVVDEVVVAEAAAAGGSLLAGERHLQTSNFDRLSQFGEKLGRAEERLEAHLHETFDHELGSVDTHLPRDTGVSSPRPAESSQSQAMLIAQSLKDPANIRQAIILGEILNRPADRW